MATVTQKTTLMQKQDVEPKWYHVDAQGHILGRLATQIAMVLMGKHTPKYTAHTDTGDYVVVTNAEKIQLTGNKADTKEYDSYSGHKGGRNVVPIRRVLERHPERVLLKAVERMMPKTSLGRKMLRKLKIHVGSEHNHQAQQPEPLDL